MAIQWTAAIREIVCRTVFNRAYADLRSEEAALLDDSNSAAAPTSSPAGIAGEALTYVRQFAQWFEEAGASTTAVPDVWAHVYSAEVAFRLAGAFKSERPEMMGKFRYCAALLPRAWDAAINTYSVADASATTLNELSITPKVCRLHVMRHCARRPRRLFLPIPTIDMTMKSVWIELWNAVGFEFKTRQASIAIATASAGSAPTITITGTEAIDSIVAPRLWYTDASTSQETPHVIQWVDGDTMAKLKARNTGTTGRPEYFSIEDRGANTRYWHFSPEPDAAYTVRAELYIRTPSDPANAAATTLQDTLTTEIVSRLPRLTLMRCLEEAPGVSESERRECERRYRNDIEVLVPRYTRVNEPMPQVVTDVYGDAWSQRQAWGAGGGL